MQEVSRRHLHGWGGALGPSFPGPHIHGHPSVLTDRSVARRLSPRFLHHDLKIWRRRRKGENRDRNGEKQLLKHAAMRSHFNCGPTINICHILPTQFCFYSMFPCWALLVCLLVENATTAARAQSLTDFPQNNEPGLCFGFFPVWIP